MINLFIIISMGRNRMIPFRLLTTTCYLGGKIILPRNRQRKKIDAQN